MLKYLTIINQLSDKDKISILSDVRSLSYKEYKVLGIPEINVGFLDGFYGGGGISPSTLANSWDKKLFFDVASDAAKKMKAEGINLAIVPGAKIKITPSENAVSEDPLLSVNISSNLQHATVFPPSI